MCTYEYYRNKTGFLRNKYVFLISIYLEKRQMFPTKTQSPQKT